MSEYEDNTYTYINQCFFEARDNFLENAAYEGSMMIFLFMTDGVPTSG